MDGDGRLRAGSLVSGGLACAVAAGLLWAAASAHLERSCTVRDTPYLSLCAEPPEDIAASRAALRQRIQDNPGDSTAWTRLLGSGEASVSDAVLRGAAAVAPYHPAVLRWRAAKAVEAGRLQDAVTLLVYLLHYRGSAEAALILGRIIAIENGVEMLRPHLHTAEHWLLPVLVTLPSLNIPHAQALPLVAAALEQGGLTDGARRWYMHSLKANGQWLDAYGLWLAYQKQPVPLLYNGGFDQAFEQDGFDWEFTPAPRSKAGVILEQVTVARRGLVLEADFTGRAFASPILRQYVFAPSGTYRLRGEYMGSKLRTDSGLTWAVVCSSGRKALAGRSEGLKDTGGVWKTLEVEFTVPPDCGPVASLQLEPATAFEATAGMKGTVAFDNFSLLRTAY